MKEFTPKNATQALRLIRTTERANNLISEGYTFFEDKEADYVAVCKPGREAASYFMSTENGDFKCECPDFVKNGDYCKHTICWGSMQDEAEMWEAICAEVDARAEV